MCACTVTFIIDTLIKRRKSIHQVGHLPLTAILKTLSLYCCSKTENTLLKKKESEFGAILSLTGTGNRTLQEHTVITACYTKAAKQVAIK